MNITTIKETIELSQAGKITFPQVVGKLIEAGIESYHVDFVRSENRYYQHNGQNHAEPVNHEYPAAADLFNQEAIKSAIKKIQQGQTNYQQFCTEILLAGCNYYIACLAGRRVIYLGRNGDFHVEHFPAK